jgi:hypothetical protein
MDSSSSFASLLVRVGFASGTDHPPCESGVEELVLKPVHLGNFVLTSPAFEVNPYTIWIGFVFLLQVIHLLL